MDTLYLACAALGGTLLVCQFLMTLVGLGHHEMPGGHDFGTDTSHEIGHHDSGHDHDHGDSDDHDSSWFVGLLSFRTIVAALAFFGVAGKFGTSSGFEPTVTLVLALAAGASSMFLVAWMMRTLYRLRSEGTVRITRSVGSSGTVYLTVPPNKSGVGKVTLKVQDRTMEYQAVTSEQNEIPTGTKVVAVAVVGPGTVEVSPVPSSERVAHV
jgi:hypothetical protein